MKFTPKQLRDWRAFEKVRASGRFNMLTPQAQTATRLTSKEFLFVLDNYERLEVEANKNDS